MQLHNLNVHKQGVHFKGSYAVTVDESQEGYDEKNYQLGNALVVHVNS